MHAVVEAGELLDERRLESRLRTLELREFCGVLGRQVLPIEEDPDGKCRGCDKNDDRDEQQQIIEPAAAPQGRTRDRRVVRYERSWYAGINHSQSVECAFAAGGLLSCRGLGRVLSTRALLESFVVCFHRLFEPKAHFTAGHTDIVSQVQADA